GPPPPRRPPLRQRPHPRGWPARGGLLGAAVPLRRSALRLCPLSPGPGGAVGADLRGRSEFDGTGDARPPGGAPARPAARPRRPGQEHPGAGAPRPGRSGHRPPRGRTCSVRRGL
ncbi:MAG: hypothetical protein AVDCRST_MAG19-2174, partial [uncultured Thermomicrobiales bacterium]